MTCNIEEVIWNGERKYYCTTHRSPAFDKENNKLEKILLKNNIKDIYYNNKVNLIELIQIINKKENKYQN